MKFRVLTTCLQEYSANRRHSSSRGGKRKPAFWPVPSLVSQIRIVSLSLAFVLCLATASIMIVLSLAMELASYSESNNSKCSSSSSNNNIGTERRTRERMLAAQLK